MPVSDLTEMSTVQRMTREAQSGIQAQGRVDPATDAPANASDAGGHASLQ